MDIKDTKEQRQAFEDWYCKNHTGLKQSDLAKFRTLSGYSFSDSLKINISWEAWQAAQSKAVPDGFVVVHIDALARAAQNIRELNNGEYYSEEIEENVCTIEAMIEAQDE